MTFLDNIDPRTTAILLIEFQNDFTTPGGVLHDAVKPCMEHTNILANTTALLTAARDKGIKVIHSPITFADDYRELAANPYGVLAGVKGGRAFLQSGFGGQFHPDVSPKEGEIVIAGKRGLCAFASTNLDFILRQNGVTNLAIAGYLTNCCVESTMRTAYERGYHVATLTDCCAATSVEAHDAAVKFTFPMFSMPLTSTEFLSHLKV
eukprot:c7026_g1_i1.p1 GENE.c7026_g1_i1~~c7026_g1_i1.p1  ORF type:complete len:231 (-),score=78.42 c7026_g1_i1:826-1446(-)